MAIEKGLNGLLRFYYTPFLLSYQALLALSMIRVGKDGIEGAFSGDLGSVIRAHLSCGFPRYCDERDGHDKNKSNKISKLIIVTTRNKYSM